MEYRILPHHPLAGVRVMLCKSNKLVEGLHRKSGVIEQVKGIYRHNWYNPQDEMMQIGEVATIRLDEPFHNGVGFVRVLQNIPFSLFTVEGK